MSAPAGTRVEPTGRRVLRDSATAAAAIALVVPLLALALWAVAARWPFPEVLPTTWGLAGWREVLAQGALPAAGRSTVLALGVALLATPAGALAGRALAGRQVPLARLVEGVLIAPVAVPPFAVVMGLNIVALRVGLPATAALVVVLVVAALPYTTWVMRSAYAGYDRGYEDAARSLGAGPGQVLWRVHLPLIAPALAAAAFLAFLVGWSDYVVTLVVGGGQLVTLPLLVASLSAASGNDAAVAAASLAAVAPPLVLLVMTGLLARGRGGER
ncbi:ABC transporter permease [Quadrisphaera oryzae]|uniref:ABC transporter permease n=1 Tax=Quadrisphaera TaxID=317661 RepID=UPI001C98BEA2